MRRRPGRREAWRGTAFVATGVGIDIGNEFVKVVQIRKAGGSLRITGAIKLPRPKDSSDGSALRLPGNLADEMKRAGIRRSGMVGLTGRDVMLKYIATPPCDPVRLRRIIDMQAGEKLPGGASEITYDYKVLNILSGPRGDLVVMAVVARNEYLHGTIATLKAAGVAVSGLTSSAIGLFHAMSQSSQTKPGESVLAVDIGADTTEMALARDGEALFVRSAPGGGRRFTQAIDKATGLGLERAETFKLQRAAIGGEDETYATQAEMQIAKSLREAAEQTANMIRSAVTFCRAQTRIQNLNFDRIVLTGGGARLKGLGEYLSRKLGGKPVAPMDVSGLLDPRGPGYLAQVVEGPSTDMAVAIGLAILDADPSAWRMDLLPHEIAKRRTFWNKTVYAAAAAALLPMAFAISYSRAGARLDEAREIRKNLDARLAKVKAQRKEVADRAAKGAEEQKEIYFLAAQGRYGLAMLNLLRFLRTELPPGMTVQSLGPPQKGESPPGVIEVYGAIDRQILPNAEEAIQKLVAKLQEKPEYFQQVRVDPAAGLDKPASGGDPFRFRVSLPWPEAADSPGVEGAVWPEGSAPVFPDRR